MKIKQGDIFTIPIDDERLGYGQIIEIPDSHSFMIAVFDIETTSNESISSIEIVEKEILLMGYTLDAKLYHKHWVIVDNYCENLKNIELPYFKLGTPPGEIFLTDYNGVRLRECTIEEFNNLIYQPTVAPVSYENALKSIKGVGEWKEHYNKLRIDYLLAGRHFIESELANN
tara:strand:- start:260 stop:775 length:516 start_codon:yes stop_codon:yes gene_type:complete